MRNFGIVILLVVSRLAVVAQSDSTNVVRESPGTTTVVIVQDTSLEKQEDEINSLSNSVSNLDFGGFGAFGMKSSHFGKTNGWMLGGVGGVSFQHKFILGFGAYKLSSNLTFEGYDGDGNMDQPLSFGFSYGGIFLEYSPKTSKTFHLSYPVFLGWGKAKVFSYDNGIKGDVVEESKFFTLEPSAYLEINVSSAIRLYGGAGYRLVFLKEEMKNLSNNNLESFVLNVGVKVGKF